ncbi:hypothetical protein [Aeromonas veronii]|uniref:hypothetical protein n=1 Tax=Aeromonas veronii TaxID=654 RepID=UPI003BA06515
MNQSTSNSIAILGVGAMFSLTALYGMGAFEKKELTYATVNFDGGYQKIGEIRSQRVFSDIKISRNSETLLSGSAAEVVENLKKSLNTEKAPEKITWKDGVILEARFGIKWEGSESNFELTTKLISKESTEKDPLFVDKIIKELQENDIYTKDNQTTLASKSLVFSEPPKSSFLLAKLASAFRDK